MNIKIALLKRAPALYRLNQNRHLVLGALGCVAVLLVAAITVSLNRLPDMTSIEDVTERKAAFFAYLAPIVESSNEEILAQRNTLLEIITDFQAANRLSIIGALRLKSLARKYAVEWNESDPETVIDSLRKRVDLVPVPLVLVQAAKESGWGTSRFAREGNNLFGQWCYTKGCGIVPARRSSGAKHEVQVFDSVEDAINAYLHNVNTADAYRSLREIRARQRKAGKMPDGIALADGLLYYSQRREAYVKEVKLMLQQYRQFQQRQQG